MRRVNPVYLLERVEGDVQASGDFLMTELRRPVDVLEDELDRLVAVPAVDDVPLLVRDNGGRGRARRLQLQLWTSKSAASGKPPTLR